MKLLQPQQVLGQSTAEIAGAYGIIQKPAVKKKPSKKDEILVPNFDRDVEDLKMIN